jgi:hypothetical protein
MNLENPKRYQKLRDEIKSPYRPLRRFIYVAFAGSGLIGCVIFLMKLLAGNGAFTDNLTNLSIQVTVLAAMIWLLRRDKKPL